MPYITTVHESLPYIDPDPTPAQRAAAESLIAAERALVPDDPHHALLPPPPAPFSSSKFLTPLLLAELDRVSSSSSSTSSPSAAAKPAKLQALDLSRYESSTADITASSNPDELRTALSRAAAAHAYVSARRAHLHLLDAHGRGAWLLGNAYLEAELRSLERDLAATRRDVDALTLRRKAAQEAATPEMASLEEMWRTGVPHVLETEAAVEGLRRDVLEARRRRADMDMGREGGEEKLA